ncbi:MAG: hypothetical protein V1794_00700 [Candidatus Glassbacteria bacterium]
MHYYEIFSYIFIIAVIIFILIGAVSAFRTFIRGEHHETNKKTE